MADLSDPPERVGDVAEWHSLPRHLRSYDRTVMIYLDYNGSTPQDPRVAVVAAQAAQDFANPASVQHQHGRAAAEAIEEGRHRIAAFAARPAQDIILTSGASEAAFLGIVGMVLSDERRPDVLVGSTEHSAVLEAAATGARLAHGRVRTIAVDSEGRLDLESLESQLDERVAVVAVMAANNETGVVHPLAEVASLVEDSGARWFCDATQLAGKGDLSTVRSADLAAFSAHKIYGPKGVGALVVDRHTQRDMVRLFPGGGQERGFRGGTQNTAGIAGFGVAAQLAMKEQPSDADRFTRMSADLLMHLDNFDVAFSINSSQAERISNTLNLRFPGVDADLLMAMMPDVAVSTGSACHAGANTPSHVLTAMGLSHDAASESLRISLGRPTTDDEIANAAEKIALGVRSARRVS